MNNLIKLGAVGSLALSSLAAHAAITIGTSSGASQGDAVLFADVFNGATLVKAYAGDTGYTLAQLESGTTGSFKDTNLATFLASATAGTTVDFLVAGVGSTGGSTNAAPTAVTSSGGTVAATIGVQSANTIGIIQNQLGKATQSINGYLTSGNSYVGTLDSSIGGNYFAPFGTTTDVSNLGGATGQVAAAGLGTYKLYTISAADFNGATPATVTAFEQVTLDTTNGLTFSALPSGGGTPVPVPAALWLLGSGLLGLAGVSRRKTV